ncbi:MULTISPECIES: cell division protein DedD [Atlantibacter]|uniref:Cell division protein DedD n=1 Tax=Atlantibacter hermannii NBRC 105704 TaxID=1115512 RepID=H5UXW5_ATLHE|nr:MULTISPECIES: cell division protein DedD [Atlantibacter]MCQ4967901.1 cell division protein DedD [Enterobacteriaceae bacterium DFI.7.85]MDU7813850.1 cell division protein DedD [Atlantibacter hermannii]MEB7922546.1 cell division protein DedD [Atlantibacter hermannii]QPS90659.1 cell division protein DedD [Atlantibacter hermannii]WIF59311.1 cell division protein DedD [Atlantibacter hermannii]
MASKFQNRLVGTIVLVALGVILLPGLLDGQKKHYQDEFAAIPLVPKPGDTDEPDMLPAATQALPAQPPEGAAEEVRAANAAASAIDTERVAGNANTLDPLPEPEPVAPSKPKAADTPKKPQPKPQKDKTDEQLAMLSEEEPPKKAEPAKPDTPPTGKAYVVQLGALKNADKVNEIVGKLRGAGYRVYTSPSTPVQGKITRILVGPDASRDKLKGSLGELNKLSGLNGVVMNYSVN